jgi:hypothetical protein
MPVVAAGKRDERTREAGPRTTIRQRHGRVGRPDRSLRGPLGIGGLKLLIADDHGLAGTVIRPSPKAVRTTYDIGSTDRTSRPEIQLKSRPELNKIWRGAWHNRSEHSYPVVHPMSGLRSIGVSQ